MKKVIFISVLALGILFSSSQFINMKGSSQTSLASISMHEESLISPLELFPNQ
jgi:hypothetical protein